MAIVGELKNWWGTSNNVTIDNMARFAIDEHNNKENTLLEFGKVVKVKQQVVSGSMYYITMEATDGGKKKVYEAKVFAKLWMDFKELQEFKHVGDAPLCN